MIGNGGPNKNRRVDGTCVALCGFVKQFVIVVRSRGSYLEQVPRNLAAAPPTLRPAD